MITTTVTPDAEVRIDRPATEPHHPSPARSRLAGWAIAGTGAGIGGMIATWFTSPMLDESVKTAGVDAVYAALDDPVPTRVGASVGFVTILLVAVFAVGYTRFLRERLPATSRLPAFVQLALTGTVGSLTIGYGFKAMLAGGIQGGVDEPLYTRTDVAVLHLIVDQIQWLGWMGGAFAIGATVVAAFRHRVLPRWFGALSALLAFGVVALTVGFALPYSAGVATPPWLILAGVVLAVRARRDA